MLRHHLPLSQDARVGGSYIAVQIYTSRENVSGCGLFKSKLAFAMFATSTSSGDMPGVRGLSRLCEPPQVSKEHGKHGEVAQKSIPCFSNEDFLTLFSRSSIRTASTLASATP